MIIMGIEIESLSATDRVQAGMAFLDQHYPGHEERVDLDDFEISNGHTCALAQAADNHYSEAVDDLYENTKIDLREFNLENRLYRSQVLGFLTLGSEYSDDRLNHSWIAAYQARRNG